MTITINDELSPATLADEASVESWLRALIEAGINFHPEERFEDLVYVRCGGAKLLHAEDAQALDRLMDRAYEVCDPCEVAVRVFSRLNAPEFTPAANAEGDDGGRLQVVARKSERTNRDG